MSIEKFNKRITIQLVSQGQDGDGWSSQDTYTDMCTVWAYINRLWGKEKYEAKAVNEENVTTFLIRYSTQVSMLETDLKNRKYYRIKWGNRYFNITDVDNIKYENKFLKITGSEVSG